MFIVYTSNKLNILLSKVYTIIEKKPLENVFEKEIFIHDNKILFQYLNIFIAQKTGISANFKLYHPDNFIWQLLNNIVFKKNFKNTFTHSIMTWKIMKILDEEKLFKIFHNKIEKFKFSFLMAKNFEKYLIYRPDWIHEWESKQKSSHIHNIEAWQIKLWIKIIHDIKKNNESIYHIVNLFDMLKSLMKKKINKKNLPNRVFVISSLSLNPFYISMLKKISIYVDIYFLYITPTKKNIIRSDKIHAQKIIKNNIVLNNSLIDLWGHNEKLYELHIIKSNKTKINNCFSIDKNKNLLNNIKQDFLHNKILQSHILKKRYLQLQDNSISIKICFNKKDEIEILYKTLLQIFHENPSIKPSDIVVTSFSIESYIPYINLVFTSLNNEKNIPFFISNNFSKKTQIILSFFKKILDISSNRFENETILELLDIVEIAEHFNITEEEIKILYDWIEEANIRWAIDGNHKGYLSFPKHDQNTWFYGIEKLLFSYAMNSTNKIWNNILSCSLINGSKAELIGKLIIFINTLKKWQKIILRSHNIKYWRSIFKQLINDFFSKNKKIEKSILIIQKYWTKMIDDVLSSDYSNEISIEILKKNFFYQCKSINNCKVKPGVINFCHPVSIYYIPFKIICIIGSDCNSVPQKNDFDNFNLLIKYPLLGDFDIYHKNCYLFLQMLSCAEKYFYISYVGYSIKDKNKISPSIFIHHLLNYIALNFCFRGDQKLSLKENKKKIIQNLCKKYHQEYFYKKNNVKNIFQIKYMKTHQNNFYQKEKLVRNNSKIINLVHLINFWKNPINYFYKIHFKAKFNLNKIQCNTTEPFSINTLDNFKIKDILLNKIINNQNIEEMLQYYKLSGKLPYNYFGQISWDKNVKKMIPIAQLVIKNRNLIETKKINLQLEKYTIHGILSEIQNTGLLRWKSNLINYSDRISLWLEHLVYALSCGVGESKIIGDKNQIWSFSPLHSNRAHSYLLEYIEGYIQGIEKPLFLTKSGSSWLDQVYDMKNKRINNNNNIKKKGYKKLLETWIGNDYIKGEKEDFYIKKIIKQLNVYNTKKICAIAKKWLTPILKHKK